MMLYIIKIGPLLICIAIFDFIWDTISVLKRHSQDWDCRCSNLFITHVQYNWVRIASRKSGIDSVRCPTVYAFIFIVCFRLTSSARTFCWFPFTWKCTGRLYQWTSNSASSLTLTPSELSTDGVPRSGLSFTF